MRKKSGIENQVQMGFMNWTYQINERGKVRIPDGVGRYPRSVVRYTHFTFFDVRLMFAYLRSKEEIYQWDVESRQGIEKGIAMVRLQTIEGILQFMATNFRWVPEESEPNADWGEDGERGRDQGGSEFTRGGIDG